jgi:hypothetical protein
MHSPFDKKPVHVQGILTVRPDGKALAQTPEFFRGK